MALAITGATLDGTTVGLRIEDGRIAELGPGVAAQAGDERLDATGLAILPGLVNAHTHAAMTLFRGRGDDLPLMEWLRTSVWPAEARLEAEDVYWGTRLACAEMIRGGITRFWDMYWFPEAIRRAVEDAGMRARVAAPLVDTGGPGLPGSVREAAARSLDALEDGGLVEPALGPHAIYTVSEPALRWIAELAGERGLPVHIHLSETEGEVQECVAAHGMRPAHYLDSVGLLGPQTLLAHGVWLDDAELGLIAERGATVVTNPVANMKLAVGRAFPWPAARARGVALGIGTDGPGSNNSLDLLADLKAFALLQKHAARDPAVATAAEAWQLATGQLSPLLSGPPIAPGAPADLILVRAGAPELALGDFTAGLVYAASASVVDTTIVAGRVLMRGGVIEGLEEIVASAAERAGRLRA